MKIHPVTCPHCNSICNMADNYEDIKDRSLPQENDANICFYCRGISIFTKEGLLRKVEPQDYPLPPVLHKLHLAFQNKEKTKC